ncbi:hypothetical protein G6F57_000269 [Rhizopus arrhizus]|uniref:Uncharacterized protein n=1 Tax=Rhizopus oryzae TaxID=64495 RepID=A0A9P6XJR3_RHIOR|nr:hypothetical protein G6F23_001413 [Rhizopus arrhizus]KAG1424876.1 hypothetical protein G6F58_002188 [Rhizopus delemar]KAG0769972.1 hypothetical protein G6F24_000633 [Rhizopus arrhizus]KAG0797068.1 hypothetical protein G6F21_000819 [Rhizopus arrhizus]KAG0818906.1 hypothetical protein G6F20_001176 [Rhizopus arrhizus]
MYSRITRSIKLQRRLYSTGAEHTTAAERTTTASETRSSNTRDGLVTGALLAVLGVAAYTFLKNPKTNPVTNAREHANKHAEVIKNQADHNDVVKEKVSSEEQKPGWENKIKKNIAGEGEDGSHRVDKDTEKAKDNWKSKDKEDDNKRPTVPAAASANEGGGLFSNLFGQSNKNEDLTAETNQSPMGKDDQTQASSGSNNIPHSTGNPMVDEKAAPGHQTKSNRDMNMESHANDVTHDSSGLVGKDTTRAQSVSKDGSKPSLNANSPNETSSFWSNLFGWSKSKEAESSWNDAKDKLHDAKEDTANTAQRDAHRLSGAWEDSKDAAAAETDRIKHNVNGHSESIKHKANDAYDSAQNLGARVKREASNEYNYQKDRLSGSINGLHKEVSDNADYWKNQTEDKAKSWYEKGTEQVKSGLASVKDSAQQDIYWAEKKVHEGLNTAKDEMDYVLGRKKDDSGLKKHVLAGERFAEIEEGQLRPTRDQLGRLPARFIVEHARGTDM